MKIQIILIILTILLSACSNPASRMEKDETLCYTDSDCVSITKMTSCYYDCSRRQDIGCINLDMCESVNKHVIQPICAQGIPCKEPASIWCVDNKCVSSSKMEKPGKVEMNLEVSKCINDDYNETGIISSEWIDDNFIVHTIIPDDCCNDLTSSGYKRIRNHLTLMYSDLSDVECNCLCHYNLTFTLTNLEYRDYEIEIQRVSYS